MAVFNRNQDSYETIEGITQRAAKQVKKAVAQTAKAVVGDVKQSLGLEVSPDNTGAQTTNPKSQIPTKSSPKGTSLAEQAQNQSSNEDKQKLAQTRANLEKINQEIKRIREERDKKAQQAKQADQAQQVKKVEKKQEQKQKDNALQQLIKSKKGTKEAMGKASG